MNQLDNKREHPGNDKDEREAFMTLEIRIEGNGACLGAYDFNTAII